jgi:CRISPR/Cas system-associated exonuclease Cas4 (RecB family)
LPIKTIRASEISAYVYCARAWWYRQQGVESENQGDLAAGNELHSQHGRTILASGCLRSAAYALLLISLLLMTAALVTQLFK